MMLHRVNDLPLGVVQDLIDDLWIAILDKDHLWILCDHLLHCHLLKAFHRGCRYIQRPAWAIIRPVYLPEP